jgi:transposase InsO family protein
LDDRGNSGQDNTIQALPAPCFSSTDREMTRIVAGGSPTVVGDNRVCETAARLLSPRSRGGKEEEKGGKGGRKREEKGTFYFFVQRQGIKVECPLFLPAPQPPQAADTATGRAVTAKRPNHVWHVDLTAVPISGGFWTTWLPFALPQCRPFCWWVAIVIDHYSRRVMGFAVFDDHPTSLGVRAFLGSTISRLEATPKYIICDKGSQFWCDGFKSWCRCRQIKPRFGAIGKHGSIAVIERFIRTLKQEGVRRMLVPMRRDGFRNELKLFIDWYNQQRPNTALAGCTPNEVYHGDRPANRRPRIEPRRRWPRRSRCAAPQTLIAGQPGARIDMTIQFDGGRRHLPVVSLKRAA